MSTAAHHGHTASTAASDVMLHTITFKLVKETFGLPILDVVEVIRMTSVTPVPNAPDFVEGVVNLRGQILPVADLRKRFNLPLKDVDEDSRIIIAKVEESIIGLIVDDDPQVTHIPADTISPPPPIVAKGIGSEYLKGISNFRDQMIILINLHKVFSKAELNSLDGMDA